MSSLIDSLYGGNYLVRLLNAEGNKIDSATVSLSQPAGLSAGINKNINNGCYGSISGWLTAYGGGGTPPYRYKWLKDGMTQGMGYSYVYRMVNGMTQMVMVQGESNPSYYLYSNGNYKVIVYDANDDTASVTLQLNNSQSPLQVSIDGLNSNGQIAASRCDGFFSIGATVSGGTPPYSFTWTKYSYTPYYSSLSFYTEDLDSVLVGEGNINLQVQDANGCNVYTGAGMSLPNAQELIITGTLKQNGYYVSCDTCHDAEYTITTPSGGAAQNVSWYEMAPEALNSKGLYKLEGATMSINEFRFNDVNSAYLTAIGTTATQTNLKAETWYAIKANDDLGCQSSKAITIERPKKRTEWGLHGNCNLDTSAYIGTCDSTDFVMKSNGAPQLRLKKQGGVDVQNDIKVRGNVIAKSLGTEDETDLVFKSNNQPQMMIRPNGNIGIGTSNPSARLEIAGTSKMNGDVMMNGGVQMTGLATTQNSILSNFSLLSINQAGTITKVDWTAVQEGCATVITDGTSTSVQYTETPQWTDEVNKIYTLCGNVGVGTDAPSAKLHVLGSGKFTGNINANDIYSNDIFGNDATLTSIEVSNAQPENTSLATISNGNSSLRIVPKLGGYGYNGICKPNDIGLIYSNGNNNSGQSGFVIAPHGGTSGIRIDPNGTVAISTNQTIPAGFKLGVGGLIICEELDVKLQSQWQDYVFAPTYKKMPLNELETYLMRYRHLPGYPSAKEVEEKGHFGVGDNIQKLTEKTEEIFLHLIEMNKKIESLEKENTALAKELSKYKKANK